MIRSTQWLAMLALLPATSLLAADQAMTIVPGEWDIELTRQGGATYQDNTAKDGRGSVNEERTLQKNAMCLGPDKARLRPEMFAPNCAIQNPVQSKTSFEAELICAHPTMRMSGNLTIKIQDGGKKVFGTQFVHGGGEKLGGVIINRLTMTRVGDCKEK